MFMAWQAMNIHAHAPWQTVVMSDFNFPHDDTLRPEYWVLRLCVWLTCRGHTTFWTSLSLKG